MDVICKITDEDICLESREMNDFTLRQASRGIIIREDGKIAILHNVNKNEYKLIGGGLEGNEDPKIAFKRETLEEAGCEIKITQELGIIEEYRTLKDLKQVSYIFVAKVINDIHELNLTEKEIKEGSELIWVSPSEALELIKDCYDKLLSSLDSDTIYHTKFIVLRDAKILEYYLTKVMSKQR